MISCHVYIITGSCHPYCTVCRSLQIKCCCSSIQCFSWVYKQPSWMNRCAFVFLLQSCISSIGFWLMVSGRLSSHCFSYFLRILFPLVSVAGCADTKIKWNIQTNSFQSDWNAICYVSFTCRTTPRFFIRPTAGLAGGPDESAGMTDYKCPLIQTGAITDRLLDLTVCVCASRVLYNVSLLIILSKARALLFVGFGL